MLESSLGIKGYGGEKSILGFSPGYSIKKGSSLNLELKVLARPGRNKTSFYPNNWIEFRHYDSDLLTFYELERLDELYKTPLLHDHERSEFIRFYHTLKLWELTPKRSDMFSASFYWKNSIRRGSEFTDWLKDQTAVSYRLNYGLNYECPEGHLNFRIWSYNDIFPYQGLLRFNEKIDDYLYSLEPAEPVDEESLEEFKEELIQLLRKTSELEIISKFEILSEHKNTSCYNEQKDIFEPLPYHREENFSKTMVGKRCVVPVYPGGVRDTVILTPSSSNTIRWLERQFRQILHNIEESAVTLNSETFDRRLAKVQESIRPSLHILRDIKKCGLTFNLPLLIPVIKQALNEVFPNPIWSYLDIYTDRRIYGYKDTPCNPPRGYCLGMANHLATLCLITIHRIAWRDYADDLRDKGMKVPKKFAIIGNDDSDIRIQAYNWEIAHGFLQKEMTYLIAYGCIPNWKKSFISPYSLFFEEYTCNGFEFKESRTAIMLGNFMMLSDIRHVKYQIAQYLRALDCITDHTKCMLSYVISHFNPEFDTGEIERDYYLGGWIPNHRFGLSTVLESVPDISNYRRYYDIFIYVKNFEDGLRPQKSTLGSNERERHEYSNIIASSCGLLGSSKRVNQLLLTKQDDEQFRRRCYEWSRNLNQRNSKLVRLRERIEKNRGNLTYNEFAEKIICRLNCTLPERLVKTTVRKVDPVHRCYTQNLWNETPNRVLKAVFSEVHLGNIKSMIFKENRDFETLDSWNYIDPYESFQDLRGLPTWIPCYLDETIQNFTSEYFLHTYDYFERFGLMPQSLVIKVPDRPKKPPWLLLPDVVMGGPFEECDPLHRNHEDRSYLPAVLGVIKIKPQEILAEEIDPKYENEVHQALGLDEQTFGIEESERFSREQSQSLFNTQLWSLQSIRKGLHKVLWICDWHHENKVYKDATFGGDYKVDPFCWVCYFGSRAAMNLDRHDEDTFLLEQIQECKNFLESLGYKPYQESVDIDGLFGSDEDGLGFDMF